MKDSIMWHQLVIAAGLLLSSCLPAEAQTLATQFFVAPETPEAPPMLAPASPTRHPSKVARAALLLAEPVPKFTAGFIQRDRPARNVETALPVEGFRTPYLTESSVVVFQFWRERLQLEGFKSILQTHNVQLGAPGTAGLLPRVSDQAAVGSAVSRTGIALVFHFGRDARRRHQAPLWRRLP
jgi:hypothetical protein